MTGKREKPEEIVSKLWLTICRWQNLNGGMQRSQLARLKEPEKENPQLRRAVSDLSLDKRILAEAVKGNVRAPRAGNQSPDGPEAHDALTTKPDHSMGECHLL